MTSIKTTARIAGFLYLLQIPLGVFGILYVPKMLMVTGNKKNRKYEYVQNNRKSRGTMESGLGLVSSIPGGLWEVFIGVWLIAKGFNSSAFSYPEL